MERSYFRSYSNWTDYYPSSIMGSVDKEKLSTGNLRTQYIQNQGNWSGRNKGKIEENTTLSYTVKQEQNKNCIWIIILIQLVS